MSCKIKRILQFNAPVVFGEIKVFDDQKQDITYECYYSWSNDNLCWTNWVGYDQYVDTCKYMASDFYLRVLLTGTFSGIAINNVLTDCYSICLDSSNPFLEDFCGDENLFNPYNNLDCALQLYQQTANSIVCMFGIPVYYLQVSPNEESADYTFKEYSLHNIVNIKQIKMLIPDGTLPSSNPKFTELDFDWENDWNVELGKSQFANAFGDTVFPKQRDLIYVPLLKRMYEVNSAYEERNEGFMWRAMSWKLALVKYNDKSNVDKGSFEGIIDNWIVNNYEDTFGTIERNEQERETGNTPLEDPKPVYTNLCDIFIEDAVRQQYTKDDIIVEDKQYNHRGNVVARNRYNFLNENGAVIYQKGYCGEQGTLSFILDTKGTNNGNISRTIIQMGPIEVIASYSNKNNLYNISFNGISQDLACNSSYLIILRWSRSLMVSDMNIYQHIPDPDVPVYKLRPELYYFDLDNPLCELTGRYNEDFAISEPRLCQINGYPTYLSNIKLYNTYLSKEDSIKESLKYTTQHENNIINDLARPISSGRGFDVR